jgi:hypothetical protein
VFFLKCGAKFALKTGQPRAFLANAAVMTIHNHTTLTAKLFSRYQDEQLNKSYPSPRLTGSMDLDTIVYDFVGHFTNCLGQSKFSLRLVDGQLPLKNANDTYYEKVVNNRLVKPYWKFFAGKICLQTKLTLIIEASIIDALFKCASSENSIIDANVKAKTIAHPTYNRLLKRFPTVPWQVLAVQRLKSATEAQPHDALVATQMGAYGHAKHHKLMLASIKNLRIHVTHFQRNEQHKIGKRTERVWTKGQEPKQKVVQILTQTTKVNMKLYTFQVQRTSPIATPLKSMGFA